MVLATKLPAVCGLSVTNVCNAACDFCGFARDKTFSKYVDAGALAEGVDFWSADIQPGAQSSCQFD
jgi:hypothetical protein